MFTVLKVLMILAIILVCLFLLSMIVYFFNLDMKLTAALQPFIAKFYDRVKRERKL